MKISKAQGAILNKMISGRSLYYAHHGRDDLCVHDDNGEGVNTSVIRALIKKGAIRRVGDNLQLTDAGVEAAEEFKPAKEDDRHFYWVRLYGGKPIMKTITAVHDGVKWSNKDGSGGGISECGKCMYGYLETKAEAIDFAIKDAQSNVESYAREVTIAKRSLKELMALKKVELAGAKKMKQAA